MHELLVETIKLCTHRKYDIKWIDNTDYKKSVVVESKDIHRRRRNASVDILWFYYTFL